MNGLREESKRGICHAHPRGAVEGVCALCLNERLLVLRASRRQRPGEQAPPLSVTSTRRPHTILPVSVYKLFPFASLLCRHSGDVFDANSTNSHAESFISINFGEDGRETWAAEQEKPRDAIGGIRRRLLRVTRWRRRIK